MEYVDLFDENRKFLGMTAPREEKPKGTYQQIVALYVKNSRNEILLTLRSPEKKWLPNCWEIPSGSVVAGETSLAGATRELKEETGIVALQEELILLSEMAVKEASAFIDNYLLCRDVALEDIVFQEGETVDAMWVDKSTLEQMIKDEVIPGIIAKRYNPIKAFLW